jgi:hypothetical protein
MQMWRKGILSLMILLCLGHDLQANPTAPPPTVESIDEVMQFDFSEDIPLDTSTMTWLVTAGSTLSFDLSLTTTAGDPLLQSMSFSFSPSQSYLTLTSFETDPPSGWTFSSDANFFSGQNTGESDLAGTTVILARLTYAISADTPIGTLLPVPTGTLNSFLDVDGNQEPFSIGMPLGDLQVIETPEPSSLACAGAALLMLLAVRQVRNRRSATAG